MKSGSYKLSRILLVFLYLFIYGPQTSKSDDGTDFLLHLIGRLQAQQGIQSTGEGNNNDEVEDDANDVDEEEDDSDDESGIENFEYEEGPTIFDPYGEEDDDDELANNDEDEEYSDGLPRVGHENDENYDESVDSDEDMTDFLEDDFVINDRANAMDPVLLLAATKNKLVPIERKGVVRRRDELPHDDEAEINESVSPHKRRKLDDSLADEKFKKSNRNEFNDILPALMGDGNGNGDGNGKRDDDKKLNDIWNGNKGKSPKNRPNKENKNNSNNNNDNGEGYNQHGMPLSAILSLRQQLSGDNTNQHNSDYDDMPILIKSDDENERPAQSNPSVIDDNEEEDLPGLTSDEDSEDEDDSEYHGTCPIHGPRPTCCEYHAMNGFVSDEDDTDDDESIEEDDDESFEEDDDDVAMNRAENLFTRLFDRTFRQQINNQDASHSPSSGASSLRQESPFMRGGSSPVVPHLHGSVTTSEYGRRRRRLDKDREEYNEDYELDPHKPVDVPPLLWSDDESAGEEDHETEEITSDSEQILEHRERFKRYMMANFTNAILSNFIQHHTHEDSDDDEDSNEDSENGNDEDHTTHSFAPHPQVRTNEQGGFQFGFEQPVSSTNQQGGFQFAPIIPPNTSFNFPQMSSNPVSMFNFSSPQGMIFNTPGNGNTGNNNDSSNNNHTGGFDPNSLHDVD